jgi:hypothetical protein
MTLPLDCLPLRFLRLRAALGRCEAEVLLLFVLRLTMAPQAGKQVLRHVSTLRLPRRVGYKRASTPQVELITQLHHSSTLQLTV